jgi:hypothetical protein
LRTGLALDPLRPLATADRIAFETSRDTMETALTQLGNYVNSVAQDDAAIVELSGFPSYQTGSVPNYDPPAAPGNLRLRHGEVSGTVIVRYKPARTPSMNQVWICTGDPNVEANWHQVGTLSGGKAILTGLTPRRHPSGSACGPSGLKASWAPGATRRRSWWCDGGAAGEANSRLPPRPSPREITRLVSSPLTDKLI